MTTNYSASPYQATIHEVWVSFIDHKHTLLAFIQQLFDFNDHKVKLFTAAIHFQQLTLLQHVTSCSRNETNC